MANESKIMNTTIVSAEAKARLTEAVNSYTPPAPEKYRALNEVKDSIIALRERKASYETIRVMLHENAGIEVSHQTVARYCREVLDAGKAKKPRRSKTPTAEPPASAQGELQSRSFIGSRRPRGPHIADSKNL
jgi:hydrogenase maturation factor